MNLRLMTTVPALLLWCGIVSAADETLDGYPIANFALTANVQQTGGFYGDIMQNPGELGEWLQNRGAVTFFVEDGTQRHSFGDFAQTEVERKFPFASGVYKGSPVSGVAISTTTFCPLGINDVEISSLPVVMLEMMISNDGDEPAVFSIVIKPESLFTGAHRTYVDKDICGVGDHNTQISADTHCNWQDGELHIPVSLKKGHSKEIRMVITMADDRSYSARRFDSAGEITRHVFENWSSLKNKTTAFSEAIPETGDSELDRYLRWYMTPAVCLTKCTKDGDILTMGYCELNQRDSYWTSWMHLVMFRDAEQRMIEESIRYQQPSGKIPTTILPLIEREDDLDINAFFILRVARFYKLYKDNESLVRYWPSLVRAMDWLVARDCEGDGIPCQLSFWGDWKDVQGVSERKYSPFSGFTYLAALKDMVYLAGEAGVDADGKRYATAYEKGYGFINTSVEDGGLWNGSYYCQRWKDGSVNDRLLQDQSVGIFFNVVPEERATLIFNSLNELSMTPYGIAETFPYYPATWGYAPATYHNGAVWPWVSFMDCWARVNAHRTHEAVDLVKRVARADLVDSGDWTPNEHINSLTGENLGFKIQGWDSALFGLVWFGLMNPGIEP